MTALPDQVTEDAAAVARKSTRTSGPAALPPMTDAEVDAAAARPPELMNGREADYFEAYKHLKSGKRPTDPDNLRKWEKRKLRLTVSSVCAELGGAQRGPIGFEQAKYRWIWYLIQREDGKVVEPDWSPGDIGPRGLAASLQASRSLLADQIVKTEESAGKAAQLDELMERMPKFGLNRRGGRAVAVGSP